MKKVIKTICFILIFGYLNAQPSDKASKLFIESLIEENYEKAFTMFSNKLKQDFEIKKLKDKDSFFRKKYGKPVLRKKVMKTYYQDKDLIFRYLWYGENSVKLRFEKSGEGQFSDFIIKPENITNTWTKPDYVNSEKFEINPVLIKSQGYALPGETVKSKENMDVWVIMIHGSGPSDRDEALLSLRPFRDIAQGLATEGVNSLRFEKNTYLFGKEMAKDKYLTVWDETGRDVVAAVNYLKNTEKVNKDNIVLLGHSLGAMMIPRICDSIDVGGAIMIAGNARPLHEVMYDQIKDIFKKDGLNDSEKRRLKIQREQIENLEKLKNIHPDSVDFPLPYGLPAAYWKDLIQYDQVESIKNLDVPLFLLQGKGDYQVVMKDFRKFRRALWFSGVDRTLKAYDKVNHFLFKNEGEPSGKEYERDENVEGYIVRDISEWILNKISERKDNQEK